MNASGDSEKILKGLRVDDLSRGGNGVARDERRVIFVPLSLTGDVVTARVVNENKRFATAEILEITEPSPERVTPPCAVFGKCGGCTWQHVPYAFQWKTKSEGVVQALSRSGLSLDLKDFEKFPAANPWKYRNRIQLRARKQLVDGELKTTLGFFARNTKDLVGIERCEIAREELNALLPELLHEADAQLGQKAKAGEEAPELKVEAEVLPGGTTRTAWDSRHGSMGFRQVNDEQNEILRKYVQNALSPNAHVLDLFGGAGNFTLEDADRYAMVECVDLGSPEGTFPGQPENYRFFRSDVFRWLARRTKEYELGVFNPEGPIEVVLDPPREGLKGDANKIVEALDIMDATKIIAIGCDADSWARDISTFSTAGWKISKTAVFDLFPQTPHVESVAVLTR